MKSIGNELQDVIGLFKGYGIIGFQIEHAQRKWQFDMVGFIEEFGDQADAWVADDNKRVVSVVDGVDVFYVDLGYQISLEDFLKAAGVKVKQNGGEEEVII